MSNSGCRIDGQGEKATFNGCASSFYRATSKECRHLPETRALLQNEPNQASATDIAHVFHFVERHLTGLRKSNSYRQVRLIEGMMDDLNANKTVKQAVKTLGFDTFFELLQAELTKFNAIYKQRRKTLAEKEKARSVKIKRRLYFLLRQLFTAIELAEIQYPELDYSPLISELNQEIRRCNFSIKQRKSTSADKPGDAAIEAPIENEAV